MRESRGSEGISIMEEQKRALAYAIAEYLQNEAAMASEDARESLEGGFVERACMHAPNMW